MTLILDAGPLISYSNDRDRQYGRIISTLEQEPGELIIPAPVTAEVDYFLNTRWGQDVAHRFLSHLAGGIFRVECLEPYEYMAAVEFDRRYADLRPGLADVSVIILARRFGTRRILTFDHRHFRAVTPLQGGAFTLLPEDS